MHSNDGPGYPPGGQIQSGYPIGGWTVQVYKQVSKVEFMTKINICPAARGPHEASWKGSLGTKFRQKRNLQVEA